MKSTLQGPRRIPIAPLLSALAALVLALSCEFVGSDMFPNQLQKAEASYDLASKAGMSADKIQVLRIQRLMSSNGIVGIFALINDGNGYKLFIFKDDLSFITKLENPNFGLFLGTDDPGNFVCGTARISPDYSSVVSAAYPGCNDGSLEISRSALILYSSDISGSTGLAGFYKSGPSYSFWPNTPIRSGYYYNAVDSLLSPTDSRLIILMMSRNFGNSLTAIDLGATSLLASNIFQGTAAQIYQNPNAVVTEVSSSSSDQAWLTIGGIVSLSHDNRTRLVRYAYGSGKELDSMAIDDTWMAAINFEDSGSYWYYYDRYTGCLFKMRSWWK
jgi:hypothetical protein